MTKVPTLLIILGSSFGLHACAPKKDHHPIVRIDPAFTSQVDKFMDLAVANGGPREIVDLVIEFRPLDEVYALCQTQDGETPVISVDPASWHSLNEIDRQNMILHEMGHCVLRRLHQDRIVAGRHGIQIPDSLMTPSLLPTGAYIANEDYFGRELFQISNQY